MTFWETTTPAGELTCWEEVDSCLRQFPEGVAVTTGDSAPFVELTVFGYRGSHLVVDDGEGRLHAQDRRRLHRLGLRLTPVLGAQCWSWMAAPAVLPPPTAEFRDVMLGRMKGAAAVGSASRAKLVEVLRDGLLLLPPQLQILSLAEEDGRDRYTDEDDDTGWAQTPW